MERNLMEENKEKINQFLKNTNFKILSIPNHYYLGDSSIKREILTFDNLTAIEEYIENEIVY
jgi:hypothetical protein